MKIFALYTTVALIKKPDWLDDFLKKYQLRGLHVTLVQPRFVEEEKIDKLKKKISHFFSERAASSMSVVFDELIYNSSESGAIMACARDAKNLIQLQKDLCLELAEYNEYVESLREEYEKNFRPHITIGDEIPQEKYQESLGYLKDGCRCEGAIQNVVLAIVRDMTTEESNNPANKIMYQL